MDVVKLIGKKISPEMAELAEEVLAHRARREGESTEDYTVRYFSEMPRRKYQDLPPELKAWVDTYSPADEVREFVARNITAERLEELEADPEKYAATLEAIPHHATWIVQASWGKKVSGEEMEVGFYPNLTGTALLEAWKEVTGTDLIEPQEETEGKEAEALAPFLHPVGEAEKVELTQLIATDKVIFPTAKAFWKQSEIATYGANGIPVNVGGGATIKASISGKNGEDINITPEQLHLQAVIGQMIMENGAPITITPAQLYKAFAGLPPDAYVHEAQEASMVEAMDALLFTEATLDISMQLEKHKRMERKPGVDYGEFLNRRANLVVGVKDTSKSVTYNGMKLKTTYTIYQAPLFFQYSYAINQLATVDRSILLGGGAAKSLPAGHPDQKPLQRRTRNINLRRYLMAQVERIKKDREKSRAAAIAKKQKPQATYTEYLTFETIAAACDIALTHNRRQQLRQDVKLVLLDFKHLQYIRDAEEYKDGRAIKGMKITV